MNVFRLVGDFSHLLAIIILLVNIWKTQSCAGISGRTQILFALVYTTRYLDLFTNFISVYNSVMKVVFIVTTFTTLYLIYIKFKATYDCNHDTFRVEFLLIPVTALSLLLNHKFTFLEVLWTFSIYLEAVAILPQRFMMSKRDEVEKIISCYLCALGSYRFFYLLNWIHRYSIEDFYDYISIFGGVVGLVIIVEACIASIGMTIQTHSSNLPTEVSWEDKFKQIDSSHKDTGVLQVILSLLKNTSVLDQNCICDSLT